MKYTLPFLLLACSGAQTDDEKPEDTETEENQPETNEPEDTEDTITENDLVINELLAKSDETDDWVELHNPTDAAIDLSEWGLVDDYGEDDPWMFPAGSTIGAGEHIIVWANDGEGPEGEYSASFKLSSDGETLHLVDINGLSVQSVDFPAMDPENSYAKIGEIWEVTDSPTPGESNQ